MIKLTRKGSAHYRVKLLCLPHLIQECYSSLNHANALINPESRVKLLPRLSKPFNVDIKAFKTPSMYTLHTKKPILHIFAIMTI